MKPLTKTEPIAIVVSMALTAFASTYLNSDVSAWRMILIHLIFFMSGTSASQLYWSLIFPMLRVQLEASINRRTNKRIEFLEFLVCYYFRVMVRFVLFRCTLEEIRFLGYLNGLGAFLFLFLGLLFHVFQFANTNIVQVE